MNTLKAVVDLNALRNNVNLIRSKTDAEVYAVVKANAYGHGLAVATFLQPYVDGFCVATLQEARALEALAIYKPILVLGAMERESCFLPYENIIYTAVSLEDVKRIAASLRHRKFFIKVNSGMNRLGCNGAEFKRIMRYVKRKSLMCEGVYTHFRNADNDLASVSAQYETMRKIVGETMVNKVHCCASNALYLDKKFHNDIVRIGLALYGYSPHIRGLMPVMQVSTPILEILAVKRGACVGYGEYCVDRDSLIGVIRVGYGDGYRRRNQTNRRVSVNGRLCNVVGQVCMDMCMVDITDVAASLGDSVYILGEGITAEELADNYGTIVYEVLTSFNDRVERIYVNG